MTQRDRQTSYRQRVEIGERATAGEHDRQIAGALHCSVWTVRKWRRKYQQGGRSGLVAHLGRPVQGALAQSPQVVREHIARLRHAHPGWGPLTILDELTQTAALADVALPSRARVAAFLQEHGWTRPYEPHGGVPPAPPRPAQQAHDEWELDAQGPQTVPGLGSVSVVNISDVVSRLKVERYPYQGRHRDWQVYQLALRCGCVQYGLPLRVSLDHDSAFSDTTSPSPDPSRLHLWLTALGIEVVFIAKPPPLAHAIIERQHQTMSRLALRGEPRDSQAALWYALDERRQALNERLPCRTFEGQPPLQAHPEAAHAPRPYRLEWEAELRDLDRVYALLAGGRWFRQASRHGEFG